MKLNEAFPSNYVSSTDIGNNHVPVTISHVKQEEVGDESKLVLYFDGKEKGLILNITNARTISDTYSDETDNWGHAKIVLYTTDVDYRGKRTRGIRILIPKGPHDTPPTSTVVAGADPVATAPTAEEPPPQTDADAPGSNEIPF